MIEATWYLAHHLSRRHRISNILYTQQLYYSRGRVFGGMNVVILGLLSDQPLLQQ